ncbi:heparan sulfate glucosamine 3-O-sulfotransferase 1-like [Clavelina lepadiformis]|uniref:heparan sulfate glucosamine 3-O-sulfotransferase 1-like n=1 Tax=Clavelina lepadiformis TaxID=159417 RepID=UPI004041B5F8
MSSLNVLSILLILPILLFKNMRKGIKRGPFLLILLFLCFRFYNNISTQTGNYFYVKKYLLSAFETEDYVCTGDGVCLPSANLEIWKHQALPSVLIIGAKKCGTRALISMLAAHPNIKTLHAEGHYFDDQESYSLGLNWYRSRMPESNQSQITIEKTPSYIWAPDVLERVRSLNPDMKLIAVLRNPVDRLLSDHVQIDLRRFRKNQTPLKDPDEIYVDKENKKLRNSHRVRLGEYEVYLSRWYKAFSPNQILVLDGDKFISDALSGLLEVQSFLGLPAYYDDINIFFNETKGFYCYLSNGIPSCLGTNKGRAKMQIDDHVRKIMYDHYKPYNERLFKLIGKSFNW